MILVRKGRVVTREIEIECRHCHDVYLVRKNELGEIVSDQRDGDFYWFGCPSCGARQGVSAELFK